MPLGVDIPVKEVQRYMGYHGIADIAPEMQVLIDKAIDRLSTQSHPRIVSKEYLIDVSEKSVVIHTENEDLTLESESLARNLKGCCGAILLAATIGPSCDMLVRRASVTSAAESVTAIIGVGRDPNASGCSGCAGCGSCNMHNTCEFSKGRA